MSTHTALTWPPYQRGSKEHQLPEHQHGTAVINNDDDDEAPLSPTTMTMMRPVRSAENAEIAIIPIILAFIAFEDVAGFTERAVVRPALVATEVLVAPMAEGWPTWGTRDLRPLRGELLALLAPGFAWLTNFRHKGVLQHVLAARPEPYRLMRHCRKLSSACLAAAAWAHPGACVCLGAVRAVVSTDGSTTRLAGPITQFAAASMHLTKVSDEQPDTFSDCMSDLDAFIHEFVEA